MVAYLITVFLLATFDNLIIVQLNILAMVKEYCGYFVRSDEAFILSDLRIEQICNVIKNSGPNIVCLQEVDQKSKALVKSAFVELERGKFIEALNDFNETFRLFALLERPQEKEKEARVCSCYKLALKLLIAKSHESDHIKVALWSRFLAQLLLQPKHRIICVRMAIKENMEVRNFGVAGRFINILLPLNLMDKSTQETHLQICKEHHMEDCSVTYYKCPICNQETPSGNEKCKHCSASILLCGHTLEIITGGTYLQCEYCLGILSQDFEGNHKCTICLHGNLLEKKRE